MKLITRVKGLKEMNNVSSKSKKSSSFLYFTLPIVLLMILCSGIGLTYTKIYSKETADWLSQCIGQDISNVFFMAPILLVSAFYASKENRLAIIVWIGTMITNIYSYVIYCFAVHFNFLFHVYCIILGLSIFSVIYFIKNNINENFEVWFTGKTPNKAMGIFLFLIALMFSFLWLSDSLPAAISNTVPDNVIKGNLLTNPVQALDFSIYLPLMFISSFAIVRKKVIGYLLAPMMLIFAILTDINIISLMAVSMHNSATNNIPAITVFSILILMTFSFLWLFLRNISKKP